MYHTLAVSEVSWTSQHDHAMDVNGVCQLHTPFMSLSLAGQCFIHQSSHLPGI